jgi:hypothetical protein
MTEAIEQLTEAELAVVMEMSDETAYSAATLAAELATQYPEADWTAKGVNRIHRSLKAKGYADFGHLVREDDTMLRGRGYWLTNAGCLIRYPGLCA